MSEPLAYDIVPSGSDWTPPLSGAVDYYAEQARLDVLSNPNSEYLPVGYAGAGGQVTFPPGAARTVLAATFATASATPVTIPGLGVPVRAGRIYTIRCLIRFRSAATTTGAGFSFDPPGTPALFVDTWQIANTGQGSAAPTFSQGRTAHYGALSSGVDMANADLFATCEGLIQPGSDGVLSVRVRSGVSGSQISVMPGSVLIVSEIR